MIATTFVEEAERCFAFFRELGYDARPWRNRSFETFHPRVRLQLVLGDDRAEVSLDDLKRLENRPLC